MSAQLFPEFLEHVTSPSIVKIILESGVFAANLDSPETDHAINMFAPGVSRKQILTGEGASLYFTWEGPVIRRPHEQVLDWLTLPTNTLIDNRGHRIFVKAVSEEKRLCVIGVQFDRPALDAMLKLCGWLGWLPARHRKSLLARRRIEFRKAMRALIQRKPLFVSVVLKRHP
jgi:hypothetical protein